MKTLSLLCALGAMSVAVAFSQQSAKVRSAIAETPFGKLDDGREITLYTLTNASGMKAGIINYGATVVSLSAPDRQGRMADVVLGYDSLSGYVGGRSYFGAVVGRYGNRIAKGRFALDGKEYRLATNDGENHLHGGMQGFNKKVWTAEPVSNSSGPAIRLTYVSKDGEEGYPGTLTLKVVYVLTDKNELRVEYEGTTDKLTILNPTQHSYFNLAGDPAKTILDHVLTIDADRTTRIGPGLIPTGELASVAGTAMDFRKPTAIGLRINEDNEQLRLGKGYDHNWVLNGYDATVRSVAELYEPGSGRVLTLLTDQPGLQFYAGNFLDGTARGKTGVSYQRRTGLCLEAQHFPDSPNEQKFPSVVLKPGEVYRQTTIYRFSAK